MNAPTYIAQGLRLTCNISVAPIAHCQAFWHGMTAMTIIGGAATSFLFFLRVRAVYEKSMPVTIMFGIFWLAIPVVCSLFNITSQATVSPFRFVDDILIHA